MSERVSIIIAKDGEGNSIYQRKIGNCTPEEIPTCRTDLSFEISLYFSNLEELCDMAFDINSDENFSKSVFLTLFRDLLSEYQRRLEELFDCVDERLGQIEIVQARKNYLGVRMGKAVDVLLTKRQDAVGASHE